MSENSLYFWQVTATLATLIPLLVGVLVFNKSERVVRFFIFYLVIGFITDLSGWYFYVTKNAESNMIVRHAYDLFEAVFLFLFIAYTTTSMHLKKYFSWGVVLLVGFWASRFWYNTLPLFKTSTQIVEAFGAAFCILQLLEKDPDSTQRPVFWLWLGVFFYCFSTFFLMGILGSKMAGVWFAHAIINIVAYLIYAWGLWRVR
jgi:hypothetical protein